VVDPHPHDAVACEPPHRRDRPSVPRSIQGVSDRRRRPPFDRDAIRGAEPLAGESLPTWGGMEIRERLASNERHSHGGGHSQPMAHSEAGNVAGSRQPAPDDGRGGSDQKEHRTRNALWDRVLGFANRSPAGDHTHASAARPGRSRGSQEAHQPENDCGGAIDWTIPSTPNGKALAVSAKLSDDSPRRPRMVISASPT